MHETENPLQYLLYVVGQGAAARQFGEAGRAEYMALLKRLGGRVFERGSEAWQELHLVAINAIRQGMEAPEVSEEDKRFGAVALYQCAFPERWYANESFDMPAVCTVREAALEALVTGPVLLRLGEMERAHARELGAASGLTLPQAPGALEPQQWPSGWAVDRSIRLFVNEKAAGVLPERFRVRLRLELAEGVLETVNRWTLQAPVVPSDHDMEAAILAAKSQVFSHLPPALRRDLALAFDAVAQRAEARGHMSLADEERRAAGFEDVACTNFARSQVMEELDDAGRTRAAERILAASLGRWWGGPGGEGGGGALDPEMYDFLSRPHVWGALSPERRREAVGRLLERLEAPPTEPDGPPWPEGDVTVAVLKAFGQPAVAAVAAAEFKDRATAAFELYGPGESAIRLTAPMEQGHGTSSYSFGRSAELALAAIERAAVGGKKGVREVGFEPTKT